MMYSIDQIEDGNRKHMGNMQGIDRLVIESRVQKVKIVYTSVTILSSPGDTCSR